MRIKEYIVKHPAGILWAGRIVPAGETVLAADNGAMRTYLHFQQVAETPAPTAAVDEPETGAKTSRKRSR